MAKVRVEWYSRGLNKGSYAREFLEKKGLYEEFMFDFQKPSKTEISFLDEEEIARYIEYKGDKYAIVDNIRYSEVFKVLPQIFDDNVFSWVYNKKYKTQEAKVDSGIFEFLCIYYPQTGDAAVDVRYTKCDNRHRNKVTLSTIEGIHNANNKKIKEAIREWREEFAKEVMI